MTFSSAAAAAAVPSSRSYSSSIFGAKYSKHYCYRGEKDCSTTFNFCYCGLCGLYNIILTQKPICYEEDTQNILIQERTKHSCILFNRFCIVGENRGIEDSVIYWQEFNLFLLRNDLQQLANRQYALIFLFKSIFRIIFNFDICYSLNDLEMSIEPSLIDRLVFRIRINIKVQRWWH